MKNLRGLKLLAVGVSLLAVSSVAAQPKAQEGVIDALRTLGFPGVSPEEKVKVTIDVDGVTKTIVDKPGQISIRFRANGRVTRGSGRGVLVLHNGCVINAWQGGRPLFRLDGQVGSIWWETQEQQLTSKSADARQIAGLTNLYGPGIVVQLKDKPLAAQNKNSISPPGLVHDYDLLQVVNELRAASAEGISVNGVRLSNYTAIRCKGPIIYVGDQAVNHPYKIEAVGNPDALQKALSVRGGLLGNFKMSGPDIELSRATELRLLAVSSTPSFRFGKPE